MSFFATAVLMSFAFIGQAPTDSFKLDDLGNGFVKLKSKEYTVELPKQWAIGPKMPWGARSITPAETKERQPGTELGVMTAGVTSQSWDQLYKTSLFFILNQEKGTATPYKLSKTATGYDSCSFQVLDSSGFAKRRYVLLKDAKGEAIALSVIISDRKDEKKLSDYFDRMVKTAHIGD